MRPTPEKNFVSEDELATQLNVTREVLQAARERQAEGDVMVNGHWIVWKKTAAEAYARSLGLVWEARFETPIEELTVHSRPQEAWGGLHFPQNHIIRAQRSNGELVYVTVMNPRNFVSHIHGKPMTFRAQKSSAGAHWRLVGREPRARGRW